MIRLLAALALAALAAGCGGGGDAAPAAGRPAGAGATPGAPATAPRSILLVTIDTLRADALGCYGNTQVRTPNLDALAARGLRVERAHAHSVLTLPSHASLLTGRFPFEHGVRDNSGFRLGAEQDTLATRLAARGYATGAFVGAFPLDARFGLARGFEVYDDRVGEGPTAIEFSLAERRADAVIAAGLAWLDGVRGRPWFLWLHLFDPHAPYAPPPPHASAPGDDRYLGEVEWVDAALAPLLERVERERARAPVLVAVTADHGEARGDHGELTHGLFAYEATLRVPLLLEDPTRVPSGARRPTARHVDLLPTLLVATGGDAPAGLPGRSLLDAEAGQGSDAPGYFEALSPWLHRGWAPLRGLVMGQEKLIDLPIPELYDLAADPGETHNLASRRPERLAELRVRLVALAGDRVEAAPGAVDAETAEKLAALGYLAGAATPAAAYRPEDDPKRLIELDTALQGAVDAWQTGRRGEAERLLRTALARRPDFSTARLHLAHLLHETGRAPEAVAELEAAVRLPRPSPDASVLLASYLVELGRAGEALARIEPLVRAGAADVDALNAWGMALAGVGRSAEAEAAFARMLALDPSNASAEQNLATLDLAAGRPREARARFERALAIDPGLAAAWNGLGVALAGLGDSPAAIEAWKRAVAADPRAWDTLWNLALLLARAGRESEAREVLGRFVAGAPEARYARDLAQARALLASPRSDAGSPTSP